MFFCYLSNFFPTVSSHLKNKNLIIIQSQQYFKSNILRFIPLIILDKKKFVPSFNTDSAEVSNTHLLSTSVVRPFY